MRREAPFALGLILGALVLAGMGMVGSRAALLPQSDLAGIWAGPRAILTGADPYDPLTWRSTTERLGIQRPDTRVYGYPPHLAVALLPLGSLDLEAAAVFWTLSGLVLAAAGVRQLLRAFDIGPFGELLTGTALLASQPALTAFMVSQWSFHLTGALALAVAWLRRHPRAAVSIATAATLVKPQLWLFALPRIARRRRAFGAAVLVIVAVIGLVAVLRPGWVAAWLAYVVPARVPDPPMSPTLLGLAGEFAPHAAMPVAIAMTAIATWLVVASGAGLPGWLTLSVLAAPYAWSYDHLLLLVPVVVAAAAALPPWRTRVVAVGVAVLVGIAPFTYALAITRGRESASVAIPLAIFALVLASAAFIRGRVGAAALAFTIAAVACTGAPPVTPSASMTEVAARSSAPTAPVTTPPAAPTPTAGSATPGAATPTPDPSPTARPTTTPATVAAPASPPPPTPSPPLDAG